MTMPQALFTRSADNEAPEPVEPPHRSTPLPHERRSLPMEVRSRISERLQEAEQWQASGLGIDPEILELFHQVEALRSDRAPYVLQIIGVSSHSGVSTVAEGFATMAALESKAPVLLLDFTPSGRPSVLSALLHSGGVESALSAVPGAPRLFRAWLGDQQRGFPAAAAADLGEVFSMLKGLFGVVVLDCPPLALGSLRLGMCRHCDGVVLVVRAEHDRRDAVMSAFSVLSRSGSVVLGTILNRQKNHLPAWVDRLLRRRAPALSSGGPAPS